MTKKRPAVKTLLRNLTEHVCAPEGGRYALNALCVEQHAVVSTDGRRVIYAPHDCDQGDDLAPLTRVLLVPPHAVEQLQGALEGYKPQRRERLEVLVEDVSDDEIWLTCERLTIRAEAEVGKYPDWRAILPSDWTTRVRLAPDYAASIMDRAPGDRTDGGVTDGGVTMCISGKDDPIVVHRNGWAGLVMPIDDPSAGDPFEAARRLPALNPKPKPAKG